MLRVYKYVVPTNSHFDMELPMGAKILAVDEQHGHYCMWALVDPDAETEIRYFRFAGTGHPITEDPSRLVHISTFKVDGGVLIWHIFEIMI
jgi:hypothetical protein